MKKALICTLLAVGLSACSSTEFTKKVKSMQTKDKHLSCRQILLEINEADFVKTMEIKKRSPNLKNVIMPLGYISTYMDSENVIDAADARVAYLERIYEISGCGQSATPAHFQVQNVTPEVRFQEAYRSPVAHPTYSSLQESYDETVDTASYQGRYW